MPGKSSLSMSSSCSKDSARGQWACRRIDTQLKTPVPSDIAISRSVTGKTIVELCGEVGITKYDQVGAYKAKVLHDIPRALPDKRGGYIVVTGVTPTSFGEGKSTTTIGLAQALSRLDLNTFACIRQPSQGPTFGMKGGAAGGGYSQVWPMDEFNLHFTGDIHAVTAANNLIAAAIDARMFHENTQSVADLYRRLIQKPGKSELAFTDAQKRRLEKLGISPSLAPTELTDEQKESFARLNIDPNTITLCRVIDTNDRFLRKITIGQSPTEKNQTRQTKFAISVASELMAILSLATDFADACRRVERMVIGFTKVENPTDIPEPVTCDDLCVAGAVCALIKDAFYPTIIQTLEGSPVLVHCGPFANVAHGNSSIVADMIALDLVGQNGFVVTEAGFASDIGFEKFMDIKCRTSKLMPDCAVLVATIRAIKAHGRDLLGDGEATDETLIDLGLVNLNAHIRNIVHNFNTPVVVAINKFRGDLDSELNYVRGKSIEAGAIDCQIADNWALGGSGAIDLAKSVIKVCSRQKNSNNRPNLLYGDDCHSIEEKLAMVATKVYGAKEISIGADVRRKIEVLEKNGFGSLPVCIAKTQMSISHDPKMKGAPTNYTFPIVGVEVSAGAGFVYALAGEISTMPGLPTRPAFFDINIDHETNNVDGLF